jgi:hypothetical protein
LKVDGASLHVDAMITSTSRLVSRVRERPRFYGASRIGARDSG